MVEIYADIPRQELQYEAINSPKNLARFKRDLHTAMDNEMCWGIRWKTGTWTSPPTYELCKVGLSQNADVNAFVTTGKDIYFGRGLNKDNHPNPDGRFANLALITFKIFHEIGWGQS